MSEVTLEMLLTGTKPASAPVQAAQAAKSLRGEAADGGRESFSETLSRRMEGSPSEASAPDAAEASDGASAAEGEGAAVDEEASKEQRSTGAAGGGEASDEGEAVEATAEEGDDDELSADEVELPPGLELLNLPVASVILPPGGNGLPAAAATSAGLPGAEQLAAEAKGGGALAARSEAAALVAAVAEKSGDEGAGQRAFGQLLGSRLAAAPVVASTTDGASSTLAAPVTGGGGATLAAQGAASTQAPMRSAIDTPFRQPGWNDSLGNRVMWMANEKIEKAEIRLNPPTLGPIDVKVTMRGDQAHVSFVSHNPAVRDALEQAMPRLREMMGDNGLQLAEAEVSDAPPDQRAHEGDTEGGGRGRGARGGGGDDGDEVEIPQAQAVAAGSGMLDAYA